MDKTDNGQNKWESPILITCLTALIGIIGTGAGAVMQGYYEAKLERQKFESQLISKALEPKNVEERAKYLLFLVDTGLINALDVKQIRDIANKPDRIPGENPALKITKASDILSLTDSVPGELLVTETALWKTWQDKGHIYAASRQYGGGRVIAFGHDDILRIHKNTNDLQESFRWLTEKTDKTSIAFSAGHCEWIPTKATEDQATALTSAINNWGYAVTRIRQKITEKSLQSIGILIIGNAWGTFSRPEIHAIEKFVSQGGGLFVAGLGWSWKDYAHRDGYACAGHTEGQIEGDLATYPMNQVMTNFGVKWTDTIIPE